MIELLLKFMCIFSVLLQEIQHPDTKGIRLPSYAAYYVSEFSSNIYIDLRYSCLQHV